MKQTVTIDRKDWGVTPQGRAVDLYTLENGPLKAEISTYGGALVSLFTPDRDGVPGNVVLGFSDLAGYLDHDWYCGCLVGRVANRLADSSFELDGKQYTVTANHGPHQLHGGPQGFNSRVWAADAAYTRQGPSLALSLVSPDGDQGYPGELRVTAVYTLAEDALLLEFLAEADQPTPVNLTHHAYFNLTADTGADCLGHQLTLRSSQYLATDPAQIPTGEVKDVGGTPFDFRGETAIGERVAADDEDIRYGKGYDHCFVLDNDGKTSERAARVREPVSGRVLELYTDMACVQFYSGNHLPPNTPGRDGAVYTTHSGFCLEPQGYVDAPNQPGFPQVTLRPEEKFRARVQFRVTTEPGKG